MLSNAALEELKQGYTETEEYYTCLLCGGKFEKGIIYKDEDILYEAEKYVRVHIEKEHGSVFESLIQLDKKITGLTDHQNSLLRLFYQGKSDAEIQEEMNIGSASTIRNHRFALKEKERQAKVFLGMMELLKKKDKAVSFVSPHKTAKMVDDRYSITTTENEKLLKNFFPKGPKGPIKTFSVREKHKLVILREISKRFESNRKYSEKEVNEILKAAHDDFVTLRRYMIEYGFMERKPDGSQYWLKSED
jgi:DNA-binding CsgD family transcriptional regulator